MCQLPGMPPLKKNAVVCTRMMAPQYCQWPTTIVNGQYDYSGPRDALSTSSRPQPDMIGHEVMREEIRWGQHARLHPDDAV